jgi:hypothetical protein
MFRNTCLFMLALVPFTASAEGFMPWSDVLAKADANGDGGVSMTEVKDHKLGEDFSGFQPWMQDHFEQCDTDKDGIVMVAEIEACKKAMGMSDPELSQAFFKQQGFMPKNAQ